MFRIATLSNCNSLRKSILSGSTVKFTKEQINAGSQQGSNLRFLGFCPAGRKTDRSFCPAQKSSAHTNQNSSIWTIYEPLNYITMSLLHNGKSCFYIHWKNNAANQFLYDYLLKKHMYHVLEPVCKRLSLALLPPTPFKWLSNLLSEFIWFRVIF